MLELEDGTDDPHDTAIGEILDRAASSWPQRSPIETKASTQSKASCRSLEWLWPSTRQAYGFPMWFWTPLAVWWGAQRSTRSFVGPFNPRAWLPKVGIYPTVKLTTAW